MSEPICAIATPYGKGAISIIRLSGDGVIGIVNKIFKVVYPGGNIDGGGDSNVDVQENQHRKKHHKNYLFLVEKLMQVDSLICICHQHKIMEI